MSKPHLIIIMADQLRSDLVGNYTPHLNRLAGDSTIFTNAYTTCPLCVPARGSFFTGTYPNSNGSIIKPWEEKDYEHGLVRKGIPNLYTMLEEDWDSWCCGKQHFYPTEDISNSPDSKTKWITMKQDYAEHLRIAGKRPPGGPEFKGGIPEMAKGRVTRLKTYNAPKIGCYDEGINHFYDGFIMDKSIESIQRRDTQKPLLLNVMFVAPHPPLEIPEPWYSLVRNIDIPENVGIWYRDQSPLQLYNFPGLFGIRCTRSDWERIWPIYAGLVALLDHCIGKIIEELKSEGLYDDSIIIFTADHGEMLGSHCLWQKMCMYQEAVHIPFFIKLPKGMNQVSQSAEMISFIDVLPTLCDLLELQPPTGMEGVSVRHAILNGEPVERDHIFMQFDGNGARGNFQRAVIKGSHKLIVDMFKDEIFFELYDIEKDRRETNNLAFDETKIVKELIDLLLNHMKNTNDLVSFLPGDHDRFLADYSQFRKQR